MNLSRFAARLNFDVLEQQHAMIAGCGTLGSYITLALARMGIPRFTLVDNGHVEIANIATQDYHEIDIGGYKAEALRSRLEEINNDVQVNLHRGAVQDCAWPSPSIMVLSLDTIEARRHAWTRFGGLLQARGSLSPWLLIDPRMSFTTLEIHALHAGVPNAIVAYDKRFASTQEYAPDPCGARSIAGAGMFCAGIVQTIVRRWMVGERVPHLILADLDEFGVSAHYCAPGGTK